MLERRARFGFEVFLWQHCPIAPTTNDIGPVVVGIDGSDASLLALRHAAREAGWRGVELHVVHALDVTPAV
ncbi:MAG: universal stress protein, partial [Acidimicrobiia bacterium]